MPRKRPAGRRTPAAQSLILCQGTVTEPLYFQHMKEQWRSRGFTVEKEHLNPLKLVEHAKRLARRERYERVFIVVDEDDLGRELLDAAQRCNKASGKQRSFHLIVSHVCFEAWLLAHRRTIPDAARDRPYLTTLVQSEGLVERDNPKYLSAAFPYEGWEDAKENIRVLGGNEVGEHPATAVPVVLEALKAAKGRRP